MNNSWQIDESTWIDLREDLIERSTRWGNSPPRKAQYTFQEFVLRPYPVSNDLFIQHEILSRITQLDQGAQGHYADHLSLIRQAAQNPFPAIEGDTGDPDFPRFRLEHYGIIYHNPAYDTRQVQALNSLFFAGPALNRMHSGNQRELRSILLQNLFQGEDSPLIPQVFPILEWDYIAIQDWNYWYESGSEYSYLKFENGGLIFGGGNNADRYSGGAHYICPNFIRYYGRASLTLQLSGTFLNYADFIIEKLNRASEDGNQICLDP